MTFFPERGHFSCPATAGIGKELGWRDIEIVKRDSGEPFVALHDKGEGLARRRGVTEIFVSLSHCREYAAAHAVIVGRLPNAR